jgi:hypothetical protein
VFVVAYLMQGATALLLGASATASGLLVALDLGSPAIALLCIAALVLVVTLARPARVVGLVPAAPERQRVS